MPLRTRLQLFLEQSGASQTHVAKALNVPLDTINRFITGRRPLPRRWVRPLDTFLLERGY